MKPVSCVKTIGDKQMLYVNDRPVVPLAYMTYYTDKNCYRAFAKKGYRLFSMPVFFASQTLNESSQMPVFSPGIFDGATGDFLHFDEDVAMILEACPDAMIFPRINLCVSKAWEHENPEELCDTGTDNFPEKRRPCFSSDVWAKEIKRLLAQFIAHVEAMPYCANIVGYQIAGGNTDEWFSYDLKGSIGKRAREKFLHFDKDEKGFYRFLSVMAASRIVEFAAEVKQLTERRLVVGAFYGYTFECVDKRSVHHDLQQLLLSDNIDFICSPVSYMELRPVGQDHPYMLPLDSLKIHKKLYFSENDTRTHLSMPPNDLPHYNTPAWTGPDKEKSLEILKMHFARAFVFGHAAWWFDMWGGWFEDDEYMAWMENAHKLMEAYKEAPMVQSTELAVYVDECAYAGGAQANFCYTMRRALGSTGLPYAKYLASDFEATKHKYKAILLAEPEETEISRGIKAYCEENHMPLLVLHAENEQITTQELKAFAEAAGCHSYTNRDAVVYANEDFLFVHTAEEGMYTFFVPEGKCLTDVWSREAVPHTKYCKKGESMLFRMGKKQ